MKIRREIPRQKLDIHAGIGYYRKKDFCKKQY
jgi:hypothetical protein